MSLSLEMERRTVKERLTDSTSMGSMAISVRLSSRLWSAATVMVGGEMLMDFTS